MPIILYLIAIIITFYVITSLIIRKNKRLRNIVFLSLSFITLLVFLFLRANFSDLTVYARDFYYLNNCGWADFWAKAYEPLYKILNFIIGRFTADPKVFFCIIDIVGLLGPFLFIYKNSKNKLLSVLIYIVIGSFALNQLLLRQAVAISITCFGFNFAINKKKLPFFLSVLLAFMFHYTAIIAILIYPIYNWKLKISKKIFWICTSGVSVILSIPLLNLITQIDKYKEYVSSEYIASGTGYKLLILYLVIGLLIFLFLNHFRKKHTTEDEKRLLGVFMLCIIFQALAVQIAVVNRIASYFVNALIILIPNCIAAVENKKHRIILEAATLIFILGLSPFMNNNFAKYTIIFNTTSNAQLENNDNYLNTGANNEKRVKG